MKVTVDTPGNGVLTLAQGAALTADTTDGSDRVALVAAHLGEPDLHALTQALLELRRRHDVLRMTVRYGDAGPVGLIGTRTVVPVELVAGPPHPGDGFPAQRFDLANGPLLHVALFSDTDGRTLLGLQAHSAVLDEQSIRRAVHELGMLYAYFAGDGPIPAVTRIGCQADSAGSTAGRVPRRLPVVSHEISPDAADRLRLIASSRRLPVALLVLAAWITADAAASGAAATWVAASLPEPSGRPPLGLTGNRVLLPAYPGSVGDVVTLAEQLHTAMVDAEPDDGGTPVTFTFDGDHAGGHTCPFEIVEMASMLAPSEVSLAVHPTSVAGWLLHLARRADPANAEAARAGLARTAALLESTGAALIDEELL